MLKTTYISQFLFQKAEYYISSNEGSELLLKINYKNNTFVIKNLGKSNSALTDESKKIATDLLKRKHNFNFAEQEK